MKMLPKEKRAISGAILTRMYRCPKTKEYVRRLLSNVSEDDFLEQSGRDVMFLQLLLLACAQVFENYDSLTKDTSLLVIEQEEYEDWLERLWAFDLVGAFQSQNALAEHFRDIARNPDIQKLLKEIVSKIVLV